MARALKVVIVGGVAVVAAVAAYRMLAGKPIDHPVADGRQGERD